MKRNEAVGLYGAVKFDDLVKSCQWDGFVKSAECKACESWGVRRTYSTSQRRKMKRNAAVGLFTESSTLASQKNRNIKIAPWVRWNRDSSDVDLLINNKVITQALQVLW